MALNWVVPSIHTNTWHRERNINNWNSNSFFITDVLNLPAGVVSGSFVVVVIGATESSKIHLQCTHLNNIQWQNHYYRFKSVSKIILLPTIYCHKFQRAARRGLCVIQFCNS